MIRNALDESVFQIIPFYAPNPGAGSTNYQFAHSSRTLSTLVLMTMDYTADANVADRIITIGRWASAVFYPLASTAFAITAGQTWKIIASLNVLPNSATSNSYLYIPLPNFPFYPPGFHISLHFENAQAGDQVSNIKWYEKVWVLAQ